MGVLVGETSRRIAVSHGAMRLSKVARRFLVILELWVVPHDVGKGFLPKY
jgi:hypothetical protein